jgi:Xaa-Pro dipeptidase
MSERAKRIFKKTAEEVDVIVLTNAEEPMLDMAFSYVVGNSSGLFEGCYAFAWPDGKVDLLTNPLEETSARGTDANVITFTGRADMEEKARDLLKSAEKIGFNSNGITYHNFSKLKRLTPGGKFIDVSEAIEKARIVKDAGEIERLRSACRIASDVAEQIPAILKVGMSEYEMAAEIGYRMQKMGASGPSFATNASFGPASAEPHHSPDDRVSQFGDTCLFDFGAMYLKYCSDVTRTFYLGKADDWQRKMYETVLEAQLAGIDAIRPGVNGKDVDAVARKIIDATEFKGRFNHSLGHGIGLSVHDGGRLAPSVDLILEEGMVVTVEPGIYVPGKGGVRIEDDVLVTKNGCEVLTKAPKELTII